MFESYLSELRIEELFDLKIEKYKIATPNLRQHMAQQ